MTFFGRLGSLVSEVEREVRILSQAEVNPRKVPEGKRTQVLQGMLEEMKQIKEGAASIKLVGAVDLVVVASLARTLVEQQRDSLEEVERQLALYGYDPLPQVMCRTDVCGEEDEELRGTDNLPSPDLEPSPKDSGIAAKIPRLDVDSDGTPVPPVLSTTRLWQMSEPEELPPEPPSMEPASLEPPTMEPLSMEPEQSPAPPLTSTESAHEEIDLPLPPKLFNPLRADLAMVYETK